MGQNREGRGIQTWQAVPEVLVGELVCVCGALEIDFMFGKRAVLALRTRLLVLEGFAAAFVALVVDLSSCGQHSQWHDLEAV